MTMRYGPDHKSKTHQRIVKAASRQFRAEGLSGPGVARVMRASGLTVGGFYKHFRTRDDLVAEAVAESLRDLRERMLKAAKQAPRLALAPLVTQKPRRWTPGLSRIAGSGRIG